MCLLRTHPQYEDLLHSLLSYLFDQILIVIFLLKVNDLDSVLTSSLLLNASSDNTA